MIKSEGTGDRRTSDSPRPLAGKRIVITRARSQATALARRIEELGGEVIEFPTIEIEPPESYAALDHAIAKIQTYDWLIFTSVNGVEQFLLRLRSLNGSVTQLKDIKIGAIGPETSKTLKAAGLQAFVVPEQYQAEGLVAVLTPEMMRGKKVLIPRAAKAREILPETLRRWGATVDVLEVYRTVIPKADPSTLNRMLQARQVDMITFTSSSTVANFAQLLRAKNLAPLLNGKAVACIGPITKSTLEEMGGHADVVSKEFTIPGLVRAIVDYFERQKIPRGRVGA
jgi:uroporphyrinogen III methyltransferase/synthase